jgi:DNA-binding CsgD family transcriptional regulator
MVRELRPAVIGRSPYFAPYSCHDVPVAEEARTDWVSAGEEALVGCDWEAAKADFEAALAQDPDDPRGLDGLGMALFWLGDWRGARASRERAYVEHRRRGHARGAADAALYVATDHRIAGEQAAWAGWLARGERCLEGVELCAEHGTIELERAKTAHEPDLAEEHARRALAIARELRHADLEISALSQLGLAFVDAGRWEEGMALLDEAMAVAMSGEARDAFAIGDTCCQMLVACDEIADLKRASEWCRVVIEFTERHNYTPLYAWCRSIYAGVLVATGEWTRAERELLQALRTYDRVGGIGSRVMALARLAELRLRQGRPEEAERLLEDCQHNPLALAPVARLRLLRGQPAIAAAMIQRRLAALREDSPEAAPLLYVLVDIQLAQGDHEGAAGAVERMRRLAKRLRRENLGALAELASADAALAREDEDAVGRLERALELFVRLGMPFEEAEARLRLARTFADTGSELAREEARAALAIFERLGATQKADEAAALLRSLGGPGRTADRRTLELTKREREVLSLLGDGLSNAEIAERLVISEKTAGHHVSHIFRKLGLRNRAEAAAYAVRQADA